METHRIAGKTENLQEKHGFNMVSCCFFCPSLVSKPDIFCLEREENQNGPISVIQQDFIQPSQPW